MIKHFFMVFIIFELVLSDFFQWDYQKALKNVCAKLTLQIGNKRLVKLIYRVCRVLMFEIYFSLKVHKQY